MERMGTVTFTRIISLIILVIPIAVSAYGFKLMRDVFFDFMAQEGFQIGLFALGLLCFLGGVSFFGGFIYYRDKKRGYGKRFVDDLDD